MSLTVIQAALSLGVPRQLSFSSSKDTLSGTWNPIPGASGYRVRMRLQSERPADFRLDGLSWEIVVPYTTATSFSATGFIWSGLAYDVQVAGVDVLGNAGPYLTLPLTAQAYLKPALTRDNSDLTQSRTWGWENTGGTVTAMPPDANNVNPYTRLTFPAANQAYQANIPMQSMLGRQVVLRVRMRTSDGTAKGVILAAHNDAGGEYFFPTQSVTGAWQTFTVQRPAFAKDGRNLRLAVACGDGTGGTAGAGLSLDVEYLDATPGTDTASAVVKTDGWTLQEALSIAGSNDPLNPKVITSHHRSTDNAVAAITQTGGALSIQGSHVTGTGIGIQSTTGYPIYTTMQNARIRITQPAAAGQAPGRSVMTFASSGTIVENCFIRGGGGVRVQGRRRSGTQIPGGNFRVRYSIFRDQAQLYSDGNGGYVQSNYSDIQPRPPGCPLGYNVSNMAQFAGDQYDATSTELIPPMVDWNEGSCRPLIGAVEDGVSMIQQIGTGSGWPLDTGLPYSVSRNLEAFVQVAYDFLFKANPNRSYSYSGVPTTFTLTFTVASAGAAATATSIPLTGNLNLRTASLPSGTVLTFTGGKTATLNGALNSSTGSSITVQPLSAALNAGDVASVAGVVDYPGGYSGTSYMTSDGYLFGSGNGQAEKQSRYGLAVGNISIGHSNYHAICAGRDIRHVSPEIIRVLTMIDGATLHDNARPGAPFVDTFGVSTLQFPNASGVQTNVWGRNGMIGANIPVQIGDGVGSVANSVATTDASLTLSVGFTDPQPAGANLYFRNGSGATIATAKIGAAGYTALSTTLPITALSAAVPAGSQIRISNGDSQSPLTTGSTSVIPSTHTYAHAMRRWSQWRDAFPAAGLTLGPAAL